MSLKLFRSTGFQSVLTPGEARLALHPAWAVALVSLWIGFAANVWLWHALIDGGQGLLAAMFAGLAVAGTAGAVLSALDWRRTVKPAATFLLFASALFAGGLMLNGAPPQVLVDASTRLTALLPGWAALFRWQVPTLLVVLGGLPVLWLLNTQLRRLSGPAQWRANVAGLCYWALLGALGLGALGRVPA